MKITSIGCDGETIAVDFITKIELYMEPKTYSEKDKNNLEAILYCTRHESSKYYNKNNPTFTVPAERVIEISG